MTDRTDHRDPGSDVPIVGRPRGEGWRDLQADGVVWEGQVFIAGDGADLAVRLIVTTSRVAFARGGEVVLEIPRLWLRPAPELRGDDRIAMHILEPGTPYGSPPETLDLVMRDGPSAAAHLVAMLSGTAGRRTLPDLDLLAPRSRPVFPEPESRESAPGGPRRAPRHAAPPPVWEDDAAAAAPGAPDHLQTMPPSSPRRAPVPSPAAMVIAAEDGKPVHRLSPPPTASGPSRNWNLPMQEYVVPRSQRRHRWGWSVKLGGLVGLLAIAAALGSGRIGSPLDGLQFRDDAPTPLPTAASIVTSSQGPDQIASSEGQQPAAEPGGIGGPSAPSLMASEPGNAPLAAPPLQVQEGSTETWTEPTVAAPAPALLAPLPVSTMPPSATLAGVGGELPSVDEIAGEVAAAVETPAPAPAAPQPAPTEVPAPEPAATIAPEPTEPPAPTAAPAPTEPPAPTEAPPPTATIAPEPTATPIPELTATPLPEPTATTAPAPAPTEIAAAQAAQAEAPAAAQAPALSWSVRLATGGQSLPDFGLPPSGAGNWVVVIVDLANTGDAPAAIPMADFRLVTSAGEAVLDPSTDLAAMIAGIAPQWTATDVIPLQPGEATRALLLFQVDPSASGMTLSGNGLQQPIADALAAGVTLNMLPAPSAP